MTETSSPPVLTKAELPEIIQRYRHGDSLQQLAVLSQRSVRTLYNWMLNGLADQDYEQLVTECLINRIADADAQLEHSENNIQIARAREMTKFARMDLERRRPHLYGPKQEVKTDHTITVFVQRTPSNRPPAVDITPVISPPPIGSGVADQTQASVST